ncbi:tetratricopeptide repeat protein [Streptomyces sp. NPDC060027]|uniref:tetratricopeptide repeat protein n=1 Tax=Streptomyces sp. NPDC060027 TaxID=3347040 RepID=UPI0036ADCCFF
MTDVLAEIARRLASGESLEAISRALRPAHWTAVLRACAVARTFDAALYQEVLRPHALAQEPATPTLEELVRAHAVESVGSEPGRLALSEANRNAYFLDWAQESADGVMPAELLALENKIAAVHRRARHHAEEVRHLLTARPEDALALFRERFAAADARRDFAACQDLVDALGDPDRLPFADPVISELRLDRAGYVRARDHWAADYSRSAQFLQPTGLIRNAERLLAGQRRVWQMYAPGGAGKTMQLRWLVARFCVPEEHDVLCARIDFDVINTHAVGRHPWLLLLEIAEQFELRLPGRAFERLDSYAAYRVLLDRRSSAPAREVSARIDGLDAEAVEQEVLETFAERLNRARPDRPVVVVVDTLEELLLHGHGETERTLRMFGRLLQLCPNLRLVLAGRYNLREHLPQALKAFPRKQVQHIQVRKFNQAQAHAYLTGLRGITNSALVRVAARKAAGLPFTLALFADLIEQDPTIGVEELQACQEPLVRYLIDRVVRRIDDPAVRWLLRYGVIPRRLRREDVFTVMRPWLARGITDRSEADDPRRDDHHLQGSDDVFPFAATEPTDEELDRAWQRLLDYAGSSSWVSRHAGDDGTVIFHAKVLAPMRLLVSSHQVFNQLHRDFVARFDELAKARPEQWVTYMKEATYHRFQAGDPHAAQMWASAVQRVNEDGSRSEQILELCEEVLGDEYLDEGLPRLRADEQPLISHRSVADAHLAIAAVAARGYLDVPSVNPSDPAWNEVERRLASVRELRLATNEAFDTRDREAYLHALVLYGRGHVEEAARVVRSSLEAGVGDELREDLQVLLSRIQVRASDPRAEASYRAAIDTARTRGVVESEARISLELAQNLQDQGRIDQAVVLHNQVGSMIGSHVVSTRFQNRALLRRAGAEIASFSPSAALCTLRDVDLRPLSPTERVDACMAEARAHLLLGHSARAFEALRRAEETCLEEIHDSTRYHGLAEVAVLRGVTQGRLLAVDEAERSFARAAGLWSDLGHPDGHPPTLLQYARFLARSLGDLHRAANTLDQLRSVDTTGEFAVPTALLWRELARRGYDVHDTSLLDVPLRSRKDLLDGGVAAVVADPSRALALAKALAAVEPPEARLSALSALAGCGAPEGDPEPELERLRPLFASLADGPRTNVDHCLRLAALAEFERVSGRHHEATRLVAQAYPVLTASADHGDPLPAWTWAQAQIRVHGVPEGSVSRSICVNATAALPRLLQATAHWLQALTENDVGDKRALLIHASEQVSEVHRPSLWAQYILRSIALVNDDEATLQAALRMSASLGYPPEDDSAPSVELARSAHEDVYDVDASFRITAAPLPTAHALYANWRNAVSANSASLRQRAFGVHPVDTVRIQADDAGLHAFPWELTLGSEETALYRTLPQAAESVDVRAVQAVLNAGRADRKLVTDGVWGSMTQTVAASALGAALAVVGGPITVTAMPMLWSLVRIARKRAQKLSGAGTVLVLRDEPAEIDASPLSPTAVRLALGGYRMHGFDVREIPSLAGLPTPKGSPAVVHVRAPLRLKGGNLPCFELAATHLSHGERLDRAAMGADLTPDRLAEWLARFEPGTQPLVVLDPPLPASPADIPLQVVLRNLFAATLFASGFAPAVLGTGLTARSSGGQTELLARAALGKISLLDLCTHLRRPPDGTTADFADADWGDGILEAACVTLFASPAALKVSEPETAHVP